MTSGNVHLHYRFGPTDQSGAAVENPLFDLLAALAEAGSIQQAARRLGVSYRHLWGSLKQWEELLAESLVHWERGQPARLTPAAERLLWAERGARVRMAPHIEALRHELNQVLAQARDVSHQVLRIDASHDLALPGLQQLCAREVGLHLSVRFAGSFDALQSLAEGRCVVAGFHVPRGLVRQDAYARAMKPLLKPGSHKLIAGMVREQGLIVASGNPLGIQSLGDVAQRRLEFADREPGAGTHLLTRELLRQARLADDALAITAIENSHVAAALAVASGRAQAALGLRAAAHQHGLGFVPVVEEDYFLVCLRDALPTPAVAALRRALALPGFAQTLAGLRGYRAADQPGRVQSLVQALPWWALKPKRSAERTAR